MLPIVYSMSINASKRCGPYSTIDEVEKSYEILSWTIKSINVRASADAHTPNVRHRVTRLSVVTEIFQVDIIARAFAMVSSPTVIIPCILIMIMMIYYLKTTNEGKTYALSELKNNLMSEREDFKKRMAQERFSKYHALIGCLI